MTITASDTSKIDQPVESPVKQYAWVASIARDIAVPVGAYFVLHALGYSDFAGLLAGTVVSALMVIGQAIRSRRLELMSAIILGGFVFGLVASLISGDPRMMIVKDSAATVLIGLAFLISAMIGKPLTYLVARKAVSAGGPAKVAELETAYRTDPAKRRAFTVLTVLWGAGLMFEAAIRIVLAYQLPIHTMAWLSPVLMIAVVGPLIALSIVARNRGRRA
ncbi:VC0807 family protein [Nocardia sp. NPDC051756]|uniref:VC0807 family protein n=1 Tax=Nocardia sp. NPDC051756 TaxID=3154751 RepID=UPI0034335BB6